MRTEDNANPIKNTPSGNDENKFFIVGIGASAGGIKALKDLFSQVPLNSGMAYVVILHLSPEFESRLAQILQSNCVIPVTQVLEEKVKVQPDHVYVIPPNRSLTMVDGYLALSSIESFEERRAPIDIFFRTLAESHDGHSVAVILSGTGSDGSMGIRRIKENGGIILVQDPNEAEFSDMPQNSIAQGLVDFVLPAEKIPEQIMHYQQQRGNIRIAVKEEEKSQEEEHEKALKLIFTQLRLKTGHDFSNYKRATILRRIERRMNVREVSELPVYAAMIQNEKEEPQLLLKDLLISVTNFFRDKTSFEALETEIIPRVFANKNSQDIIRLWVSACATGEEAYSIAMLCAEKLSGMAEPPIVQIFATDIDNPALAVAREGFYTNADVADVSPERLRRFFIKEGSGFRVRRELRETILFARHNIIKDPPFSRLDLATCRNLLIYFNRTAQDRVIDTFHFALNPGGYLFLGSSETIDGNSNLYSTISREHCIFQSRAVISRPILPIPDPPAQARGADFTELLAIGSEVKQAERISVAGLHHQLLELYAPPSILINAQYDIIHVSKNAGRYLQINGEPSLNLLSVVRPEIRLELRGAVYSAAQTTTTAQVANLKLKVDADEELIDIIVKPFSGELDAARGFMLVLFQPSGSIASQEQTISLNATTEENIALHLEQELINTRSQFRQLSEQYEVQTEEFKASNEELQAINEELRSAAEELETSKEELQSVNEELSTVNQELKIKIEELSQTNNDFKNLINATNIGTIFLDRSFSVSLFTPAACEIFNLKPADYARPLSDITNRLSGINIMPELENVMASLQPTECEVETTEGNTFLMRILPYRTAEDHINGVILTFINITARKNAEEALRTSEERMRAMFTQARAGVVQTDLKGYLTMVNRRFSNMLGYDENELIGMKLNQLIHHEDSGSNAELLEQLFTSLEPFDTEQRYVCKDKIYCGCITVPQLFMTETGLRNPFLIYMLILIIRNYRSSIKTILLALPATN